MEPRTVTVAILTYRRNAVLARLLDLLESRLAEGSPDRPAGWDVDILVVDNDPDGGARETVEESALPIRYVHETTPGIAAGRARAMAEATAAGSTLIAFVDDDEEPEAGWLGSLISTWADTGAAAVAGRLVPRYPETIDPWLVSGRFFERRNLPTGTEVGAAPSGNLLLDLAQVRRHGIEFDQTLGLRGGEDTLFTRQLHMAGARLVFCRESVVIDPVPADRATVRWVLKRIYSHGSGEADIRVRVAGAEGTEARAVRARTLGDGVARMAGGVVRLGRGAVTRDAYHQAEGVRTLARGLGIATGALARPYVEYMRPVAGQEPASRTPEEAVR